MSLPTETETLMFREAAQTADVVAAQFARNADTVAALAQSLRDTPPPFVVTCARGSSDHAATYAKYLFETQLGIVTASASPSVGSVYASPLQLRGALYIVISQSGKSPDLLRNAEAAKAAGARVVALVNVEDSPLAQLAEVVIPLGAGPEKSVAATKSYLASLAALLHLARCGRTTRPCSRRWRHCRSSCAPPGRPTGPRSLPAWCRHTTCSCSVAAWAWVRRRKRR
ncbi:glucosamine-6-phosphate deaminase [Xanthomonas arboricola pv. pruni str. MAFF 311562]|uniref:Glucosamine-6-phosphate deaminase n=1 Tax=Xanthomonas arboricola pv. pruni str. MAFF 311562 TaxID=1414836 RepID=W4S7S8_9XANT|nr:glucosamine-6-phosphate deaminase [Xanthomonas arboricola pv. pruni str. MAFF 311562]